MAARYLGLAPEEIMMVDPALADVESSDEFDINAADFEDLATQ
jgi:hypothetical protein